MVKALLRKQMMEVFRSFFYNAKTNTKRSKGATIAYFLMYFLLIGGCVAALFYGMSVSMCQILVNLQLDWFYFATMSCTAILLGTFGSAFSTYSGLYLSKDNNLLLSMPIPISVIIAVRLTGVYLLGLFFSGLAMLPAFVVYWTVKAPTASVIIGCVILMLLISLLVLVLSCLLGWLVAKISLKLKNKSFITVIVSLCFFAAYMLIVNRAKQLLEGFVSNAMLFGTRIYDNLKAIYLWGCVGTGDWKAIVLCTLAVIVIVALTWLLLSKTFMSIAISTGKTVKREYHEKRVRRKSVSAALLQKERKRFLSSANYMLNSAFGALFIPLFGIVLLVAGNKILPMMQLLPEPFAGGLLIIVFVILCMLGSTVNTATASVSLEGKSLWLVQSLPVTPWAVLKAKLSLQLNLLGIPTLLACICIIIMLRASAESFLILPLALSYILFISQFDLLLGIKKPNLNWTSEIVVVKQSAAVSIALFSGWAYGIIVGAVYFLFAYRIGVLPYLGIVFVITALADWLLWKWLKNKGSKIFSTL